MEQAAFEYRKQLKGHEVEVQKGSARLEALVLDDYRAGSTPEGLTALLLRDQISRTQGGMGEASIYTHIHDDLAGDSL